MTWMVDIKNAIPRDCGRPSNLRPLALDFDQMEENVQGEREEHTTASVEATLAVVMLQAYRVGDAWGPYFRGRGFKLLKTAKWLSCSIHEGIGCGDIADNCQQLLSFTTIYVSGFQCCHGQT